MAAPKRQLRLIVRRPFSYQLPGGERHSVARGQAVPDAVLKDVALRGRLIRCNFLYDPDHPEGMGVPAHRAERVAAELEALTPAGPVPQDTPDEQERDTRRAQRDAMVSQTLRPWFEPHPPVPDQPAVWGPDIPVGAIAQEG